MHTEKHVSWKHFIAEFREQSFQKGFQETDEERPSKQPFVRLRRLFTQLSAVTRTLANGEKQGSMRRRSLWARSFQRGSMKPQTKRNVSNKKGPICPGMKTLGSK